MGAGSHLAGCDGQPCAVTRNEDENSNIVFNGFSYLVADVVMGHPAVNVTWYGADAYCRAMGRRLPTEAEWERAARGTENRIYPWGDVWDSTLAKTSISPDEGIGAMPVGSFPAGASMDGALDMAGNVAEWVSDWYDPVYYQNAGANSLDPTGPIAGTDKVVRGGSWDAKPFFARSVHRQFANPAMGYL
jgi:eukaryotic-like serine/threonine-protein kinase